MAIVHTLTSSIFRPFVESIALGSRTPPLGYLKRRPRGPYCRSGYIIVQQVLLFRPLSPSKNYKIGVRFITALSPLSLLHPTAYV